MASNHNYRPLVDSNTKSTIDGAALAGAVRGIGGAFGYGKTTAIPSYASNSTGTGEQDGMDQYQQPTMVYQTKGGDYWDRLNGRTAELGNLGVAQQQFGQNLDLYGNQQRLNQTLDYNSKSRIRAANDANQIDTLNGNFENQITDQSPARLQARVLEQILKKVMMQGQVGGQMAANQSGATEKGIIAQHLQPDYANQQAQAGTRHTNAQTDTIDALRPYQTAGMGYDNQIRQVQANNANAMETAKLEDIITQNQLRRAQAQRQAEIDPFHRVKQLGQNAFAVYDPDTGGMKVGVLPTGAGYTKPQTDLDGNVTQVPSGTTVINPAGDIQWLPMPGRVGGGLPKGMPLLQNLPVGTAGHYNGPALDTRNAHPIQGGLSEDEIRLLLQHRASKKGRQ